MPWIYSKESQDIYNDMVKIAFYQVVCHKMLKNNNDKLCAVLNQIPLVHLLYLYLQNLSIIFYK